jgi:hypothetical protein
MEWKKLPLNFQLQQPHSEDEEDEAQFPGLETLVWRGDSSFNFSTEECAKWARCADWSKLNSLDMDQWTEWEFFFRHLTGIVPQLRRLSFSMYLHRKEDAADFPEKKGRQYVQVAEEFVKAISGLETLTFRSNVSSIFSTVLALLLEYQWRTLEELEIGRFDDGEVEAWEEEDYIEVLEKAPKLRFLRDVVEEETDEEYDYGLKRRLYVPFEGEWATTPELTPQDKYQGMRAKKKIWVKRGGIVPGLDYFV